MTTRADTLAMDAGQTGVRTELRRRRPGADDEVLDAREYPGVRTDLPLLPQLATLARQALADGDATAAVLAVGSSGLTPDMPVEELAGALAGSGLDEVRLAHDSITSYLAALGDDTGAVVAAGTGVVTLAVGRSTLARVDGWGHLIGDAGSGYWIGRAALDAAMRDHDGRGPATALTALATEEFGDLEGAYMVLQADERRVSRIGGWARTTSRLADEGDTVCRAILAAAGTELATSVVAGLRRVGETGETRVSRVGKVFSSSHVVTAFEQAVHRELPQVRFTAPRGAGIDGAAHLATLDPGSPLGRSVSRAVIPQEGPA